MILVLLPIGYIALFLSWTVMPIVLPRDRLGTWLTGAQLALSVTAALLAGFSDLPLAQPAAVLSALGGVIAAVRLLLQRAFRDRRAESA
ncbi:hypothetical protein GCM10010277_85200 [Streptomyces longisporoflavus]|uniref:hypothetical protein n=1 Tax=Streptomyces longisporoflavus TaxID=28044 RepID=UPI00167DA97B|nr:hypothetical protein [Streptomyces longisporoflavus]GGV72384.1 hypothetical protein GCM10010277_85200 [Streptomyces longisporoflavus]